MYWVWQVVKTPTIISNNLYTHTHTHTHKLCCRSYRLQIYKFPQITFVCLCSDFVFKVHDIFNQKTVPAGGVHVRDWVEVIFGERSDDSFRLFQLHYASEEWTFVWKWHGVLDNSSSAPSSADIIVRLPTGEYYHLILIHVSPRVYTVLHKIQLCLNIQISFWT